MTDADPYAELRKRPGWWARLAGEDLDLSALAEDLRIEGVRIIVLDGRYYLGADELNEMPTEDSAGVERRAGEIVRILNGAAKLAYGNSREVRVEAGVLVTATGEVRSFVHMAGTIRSRGRVSTNLTVGGADGAPP